MPRQQTGLSLPPLYDKQVEVASNPARFRVVGSGRQIGKSLLAAQELIVRMLNHGHACWLIAPDYKRTSYVLNYLIKFLHNVPTVQYLKKEMRFNCDNGGYIQLSSADDPLSLKGDTLDFVVMDEAAFIKPEAWYESVRPMLTVRKGGALMFSTFFGRNWYWELWQYATSGKDPEWAAFKFPTSASPFQSAEELAAIQRTTPAQIFAQEYMAEPMSDNALVFRNVDATCVLGWGEYQRHHLYVAGLDWGGRQDYTVLHLLDASEKPIRSVAKYRFNEVGYIVQREWLKQKIEYWKPSLIIAEQNAAGEANIEQLRQDGVRNIYGFETQTKSKQLLIGSLVLAIENHDILLLNDPNLKAELLQFEAQQLPSGIYKYGAPGHGHDDEVIALGLAYFGASGEFHGQNQIRKVKTSGLYESSKSRQYPTWGKQPNIILPR